ncbi:MAG: hypothetical protein EOO70_03325 [Myxococcaceae bacterium]|nr:MAG: hypothetical protein EOO70_03325 [Myxococcaceae bacterium]
MENQSSCIDAATMYIDGQRVGTVQSVRYSIDDHLSPALKTMRPSVYPTLKRIHALCESPDFETLEPKTQAAMVANLEELHITYAIEQQLERIEKQLIAPSTGARRKRRLRDQQQRVAAQLDARPVVG